MIVNNFTPVVVFAGAVLHVTTRWDQRKLQLVEGDQMNANRNDLAQIQPATE